MWPGGEPRNAVRIDTGVFEVVGLIKIRLLGPASGWWHVEDFDNGDGAKGAVFRCYEGDYLAEDGNLQELAYLMAVDVSGDPSEPDISRFDQSDVAKFDRELESAIQSSMAVDGRRMTKWMESHLSETVRGKGLVSAYIACDQGRDRQYFDLRVKIRNSNVLIGGCFDIARKEDLAAPIWQAIQEAAYYSQLGWMAQARRDE